MYLFKILAAPVACQRVLLFALTLALSSAMAQTASNPSSAEILVRGPAGTAVSVNDVLSELQRAPEAERKAVLAKPEVVQQIASNLLVRRVLAAEAERDGLNQDPIVAAALTVARDHILSDARLARLDAQNAPTEAALDAYARSVYQANSSRFEVPAQTRAHHILLANTGPDSLKKAQELLAQLRAGASFNELAKANSIDPGSAAAGGDLGFFGAGKMVRPFEDAVNALAKPGDLSEPVESQFGYHIIRLDERRPKGVQPYSEVRPQLMGEARAAMLSDARIQKAISMNKDFVFDQAAIEALAKSAKR